MRIAVWSDGMYHATGLAGEGRMLADLPYVSEELRRQTVTTIQTVLNSQYDDNNLNILAKQKSALAAQLNDVKALCDNEARERGLLLGKYRWEFLY